MGDSDPYAVSLIQKVGRSTPEVLFELMEGSRRGARFSRLIAEYGLSVATFNIGTHVNRHIQAVGAKLTCALHYWETGNILPETGGIFVRWWTNANRLEGEILSDEIWSFFSSSQALTQGKKNSLGQFEYTKAITEGGTAGLYFSTFGQSFAILGIAAHEQKFFERIISQGAYIHRPGNFLGYEERQVPGTLRHTFTRPLYI